MAFLPCGIHFKLGTPQIRRWQNRRMANHRLANARAAVECEFQATVRRSAGSSPPAPARSANAAALRALRGHAQVLPRGDEKAAASLFRPYFSQSKGGHCGGGY